MKLLEELAADVVREADRLGGMHSTQFGGMPTQFEIGADLDEHLRAVHASTTTTQRRAALMRLASRALLGLVLLNEDGGP